MLAERSWSGWKCALTLAAGRSMKTQAELSRVLPSRNLSWQEGREGGWWWGHASLLSLGTMWSSLRAFSFHFNNYQLMANFFAHFLHLPQPHVNQILLSQSILYHFISKHFSVYHQKIKKKNCNTIITPQKVTIISQHYQISNKCSNCQPSHVYCLWTDCLGKNTGAKGKGLVALFWKHSRLLPHTLLQENLSPI